MTVSLEKLAAADVRAAAVLHRLAFPDFFLSGLGTPFLEQFYSGFIDDSSSVTLVARNEDQVLQGVVVGTVEPAGFFSRLLRLRWQGFLVASVRAALVQPRLVPRLIRAARYRGDLPSGANGALLSSICVDPAVRGQGIGQMLLDSWVQDVAFRQVSTAHLTTDAQNNDAVNDFYRSRGWTLSGSFKTRTGRRMNRYILNVDGNQC